MGTSFRGSAKTSLIPEYSKIYYHKSSLNIYGAHNGSYIGTWGEQAPNDDLGLFNLGHVAASLANVLNIESPVTAVQTLLKPDGGKLVSRIPTGKIIS